MIGAGPGNGSSTIEELVLLISASNLTATGRAGHDRRGRLGSSDTPPRRAFSMPAPRTVACPHCRQGHCPWDRTLGLQGRDLTPAAVQLAALAGILTSCGEARTKALPKRAGLRLAESTGERITEAAGQRSEGKKLVSVHFYARICRRN